MLSRKEDEIGVGTILGGAALATAGGVGLFIMQRYHVCTPSEFLVRTGYGIKRMEVARKALQLPFQEVVKISMHPRTYSFDLHNMSSEKVEFKLPVVFTIAPVNPEDGEKELELFCNYATVLNDMGEHELENTVRGMIEGETRTLTATMTIEKMFSSKDAFRNDVVDKIKEDLDKLGLRILNANIREMTDYDENNKYFEYRKQRAIQNANYDAEIDVAEARKKGESGVAARDADTRVAKAEAEMTATVAENTRQITVAESKANLAEAEALSKRRSEVARVEAEMAALERKVILQKEVDARRFEQETESKRASILANAIAQAEATEREAQAKLFSDMRLAEATEREAQAKLFSDLRLAEARERNSEAQLFADMRAAEAQERLAHASLVTDMKRAEGIKAIYEAQAQGVRELETACQSDPELLKFYMALEKNLYPEIAGKMAEAVQGLDPTITIWNTGNQAGEGLSQPLIDLMKGFAPFVDTISKQTDIKMPTWMPHVPATQKLPPA